MNRNQISFLAAAGIAVAPVLVLAANRTWTATGGGNFFHASNWNPSIPASADNAIFDLSSSYTITFAEDATSGPVYDPYSLKLLVGDDDVTLDLGSRRWYVLPTNWQSSSAGSTHLVSLGQASGDDAVLSITSGEVWGRRARIGEVAGSTGHLTITNYQSALYLAPMSDGALYVGDAGSGTLDLIDGGQATTTDAFIGAQSGSTGAVNVTGALSWFAAEDDLFVGGNASSGAGTGVLNVNTGGETVVNDVLRIYNSGTVNLSGGTLGVTTINKSSNGTFNWTAGKLQFFTDTVRVIGSGQLLGNNLTLESDRILSANGNIRIDSGATLTLDGGGLYTPNIVKNGGAFNFLSGHLWLQRNFVAGSDTVITGSNITLNNGKHLQTFDFTVPGGTEVHVNNGEITAFQANIAGWLDVDNGTFQTDNYDLTIDNVTAEAAKMTVGTSGNVVVKRYFYVGQDAYGSVVQNGGTVTGFEGTSLDDIRIGNNAGSHGAYTLNGGSLLADRVYIGRSGNGEFVQTSGNVAFNQQNEADLGLFIAYNTGSTGAYRLSGGSLNPKIIEVGNSGQGSFEQTGGDLQNGLIYLGRQATGAGSYDLDGGTINSVGRQYVGHAGTGEFVQTGGTNNIGVSGNLILAHDNNSDGSYTLEDGSVEIARNPLDDVLSASSGGLFVGRLGTGRFYQTGGTINNERATYIGWRDNCDGRYELTDGTLNTGWLFIFAGSNAGSSSVFVQSGGNVNVTHATSGSFAISQGGGAASYELSGGSLTVAGQASISSPGYSATGGFIQTGGQADFSELAVTNSYDLSSGSMHADKGIIRSLTDPSVIQFTQSGGTADFDELQIGDIADGVVRYAHYSMTGGTLTADTLRLSHDNATLDISNSADVITTDVFLGNSGNSRGIINIGAGSSLTVNDTLTFRNSISYISIEDGGQLSYEVLAGIGNVQGDLTNVTILAPGSSPGTMSITGNLFQAGTGIVEIEIADPDLVGGMYLQQFDVLSVSGDVVFDGVLRLFTLDDFIPAVGDQFQVITYASHLGKFDSVEGNHLGEGRFFDPVYSSSGLTLIVEQADPGDADLDGDVDLSDLSSLASHYGALQDVDWLSGDFDHDGDVDLNDLSTLASNYGSGEAQAFADFAAIASVPEPIGAAWLCVLTTLAIRRKKI
jgi:T5SS/PEP-CTERM-associated repeat protein